MWDHGDKIVNIQPNRLGLRKHIISCGNLSLKYGSIIVLEDDLYVSPNFYTYAKESINKYRNDDNIAGISLYSYLWNVNCSRPFIPADDGNDAYFMQFAQSWGQVWTDTMWKGFIEWYGNNCGEIKYDNELPENVTLWPTSSWLKYYIRYIVKTNRYFVYPRVSLTTNFGDKGFHVIKSSPSYQVPLMLGRQSEYKFPSFDNESIKYDVFFERVGIGKELGISEDDLCTDLYGNKRNKQKKNYWLTMRHANYKILFKYGLKMRPHEVNIYNNVQGDEIFCYDTNIMNKYASNNIFKKKLNTVKIIEYDLRDTKRKDIWLIGLVHVGKLMMNVVRKIYKLLMY